MGKCPECNSPVEQELLVCPECGCDLQQQPTKPGSDTLDAREHFLFGSAPDSSTPPDATPAAVPPPPGHDTLHPESNPLPGVKQTGATSKESVAHEPDKSRAAVTGMASSQDSSNTQPHKADIPDPTPPVGLGDGFGTVRAVEERAPKAGNTAIYSENELRDVLEGKGASGTAGRLKRLWDAAAGSSNNPLNSLRGEEPLASDSLFKRVASRRVAQANAPYDAVADYIIVNKVGEGGMGVVYSARQTNVDRLVALKAIKSELQASDDNRRKFFYEAQITADLDHPNIVPIYELGASEDGLLFYSMKLITGTEWKDAIRQKTREENLEILAKINDAMAFSHSKGIIHRDLKPANVMLGPYGEVYVTDWGMAIDTKKKQKFGPGGSPVYMAPEMATHAVGKIGIASDIYILGAILYQILTGQPPHPGTTVSECLRAAANNQITPFESDDALLPIALRAMATDPADRYRSVEEFQEALREYRRHAESIALAHRSEELLASAQASKDYDLFARAVFGYRDAVELWPGNQSAVAGMKRAQLAYGKCAVDKGDYDLAMQTLNRHDRQQAVEYTRAVKGKAAVEGRENRLKTLRRAIAVIVLAAVGISSTLAFIADSQRKQAVRNLAAANEAEKIAINEKDKATKARDDAKKAQLIAETSQLEERKAKDAAEESAIAAEVSAKEAIESAKIAMSEKMAADEARVVAVKAKDEADNARAKETLSRIAAQKSEAKIQLGNFQSNLALAKSRLESFDLKSARDNLVRLGSLTATAFKEKSPKTDTWPWQRVNLLSNVDLPKTELGSKANALDFAPGVGLGVVGTEAGQVHIVSYADGKLKSIKMHSEPGASIEAVAISPKGDEVVFTFKQGDKSGFRAWPISASAPDQVPTPVKAAAAYSLQGFTYSADGTYMVAGINNGIWLWSRSGKWYEQAEASKQYKKIRGRLKSLSIIGGDQAIVASQLPDDPADKLTLYTIDLNTPNISKLIPLPDELKSVVSAVTYDTATNHLILGTNDGRLFAASIEGTNSGGAQVSNAREILPAKHKTAIQRVVTEATGQMLTTSAEPVAHTWRLDAVNGWTYDTYLTGTPENIAQAAFMGPGQILGIDQAGLSIAWDVERQKQRRQLTRSSGMGSKPDEYAAPVVGVFSRQQGQALAVDANGMIELWNLNNGRTINFGSGAAPDRVSNVGTAKDAQRWSYIGHTPGAEFVDSVMDNEAGIVVTSARLNNVDPVYLNGQDESWEFCVWDQKSGNMRRRWRSNGQAKNVGNEPSNSRGIIEQRISLVDHGQALILASDSETRLVSLDGKELFHAGDFGTYFAVPHPQQPHLLLLVMRSGSLRVLNLQDLSAWKDSPREYGLTTISDIPLQGMWSPEGKRFYLTFKSGAVAAVGWDGVRLILEWSSHKLDGEPGTEALQKALANEVIPVKSHADVDMAIHNQGPRERLYITRRARGARGTTELTVLEFQPKGDPSLVLNQKQDGILWLEESGTAPHLSQRLHSQLKVDINQVFARRKVSGQTYITTHSANVFRLIEGTQAFTSYGHQKLLDVTGNKNGTTLILLHQDGSLLRFELSDALEPTWRSCGFTANGCKRVQLSPDGSQLAVLGTDEQQQALVRLLDAQSGAELQRFERAAAVAWDPSEAASLAVCHTDGSVELLNGGVRTPLRTKAEVTDAQVVSLHYLMESFSQADLPALKHLLLQTESGDSGHLQFISLNEVADEAGVEGDSDASLQAIDKDVRLATSPTEGTFVTGDAAGTVKIWFASPSWDRMPKELYELEGHRGAAVELVKFSQDGATLISSDSKKRVFGWLSRESTSP